MPSSAVSPTNLFRQTQTTMLLRAMSDNAVDKMSEQNPIVLSPNVFVEAFPERHATRVKLFVQRPHGDYEMQYEFGTQDFGAACKAQLKANIWKMIDAMKSAF